MTTNRLLTLRLDPDAGGEGIAGWLCDERGREDYFGGWLDLLTLLEQARVMVGSEPHGGVSEVGEADGGPADSPPTTRSASR